MKNPNRVNGERINLNCENRLMTFENDGSNSRI
jgi:hypothetical protein